MYKISISSQAKKYIKKQDAPTIRRLTAAIDSLKENPQAGEPLTNHEHEFKLRVGNFRILYDLYEYELVVKVAKVLNRGDVYKR